MRNPTIEFKHFVKTTFFYQDIQHKQLNHDEYWVVKKGRAFGTLNRWQKYRADFVLSVADKKGFFIDVGCGDGAIIHYLLGSGVEKIAGVDASEHAVSALGEQGIDVTLADLSKKEDLSELKRADYYFAFEILEHIQDCEKLLFKIYELSDKGVFVSFPNTGYIKYRLRLLFGSFPIQWKSHPGEHARFWTLRDLQWWLRQLGFFHQTKIKVYEGIPLLNKILPGIFGAAFVMYIEKK